MSENPVQPLDYYHSFAATRFGERAQKMPRWWLFLPETMNMSEWQDLLGADVNNLEHGRLQYGMTRWFIENSRQYGVPINQDEARQLLIAAIAHDHVEALDGREDIPTGQKSPDEKLDELNAAYTATVDGSLYPDLSAEARQEAADVIRNVLAGDNPKLHGLFVASEYLNHLRTVLIAYDRLTDMESSTHHNTDVASKLHLLVSSGISNTIPRLAELSKEHPLVEQVLASQHEKINSCTTLSRALSA